MFLVIKGIYLQFLVGIDLYGFFGADTDISTIHGLITDISKIFKSCFFASLSKI